MLYSYITIYKKEIRKQRKTGTGRLITADSKLPTQRDENYEIFSSVFFKTNTMDLLSIILK